VSVPAVHSPAGEEAHPNALLRKVLFANTGVCVTHYYLARLET